MNEHLKKQKAFIIGGGGVGSNVARLAVQSGFGHVAVMDPDTVERGNTEHGYPSSMVGLPKVEALGRILKDLNPNLDYEAHQLAVTTDNIPRIREMLQTYNVAGSFFDAFRINGQLLRQTYDVLPWVHGHERNTSIGDLCLSIPKRTACIPCSTNFERIETGRGRNAEPESFVIIAAICARLMKALCLHDRADFDRYRHYFGAPICRGILNQLNNPVLPHRRDDIPLYLQLVRVSARRLPSCQACRTYLRQFRK